MSSVDERLGRNGLATLLRANQAAAKALPEPGEVWVSQDVDDELAKRIRKFVARDVIKRVGYASPESGARKYRTAKVAYAVAQRLDTNTAPCGHSGVRNLGGGEFTCCYDDCDETFGRDVAKEVHR